MPELEQRIQQWEKMASQAPDDMAFFSLGSAYKEAGRLEDADNALKKAIELNKKMSRAYQLRGQVLIKLDKKEEATALLKKGYVIANDLGDIMPKRAMGALLEKLGKQIPEIAQKQEENLAPEDSDNDENTLIDRRTGRRQKKLDDPPMRGAIGDFIYNNFGQDTWRQWIGQGTKVINELGLDFSKDEDQKTYEQYMLQWLQISEEEIK